VKRDDPDKGTTVARLVLAQALNDQRINGAPFGVGGLLNWRVGDGVGDVGSGTKFLLDDVTALVVATEIAEQVDRYAALMERTSPRTPHAIDAALVAHQIRVALLTFRRTITERRS